MRRPTLTSIAREAAEVFAKNHWTWRRKGKREVPPYVPGWREIRATLVDLIEGIRNFPEATGGETGRLRVEKKFNEHGEVNGYEIMLIADSWSL